MTPEQMKEADEAMLLLIKLSKLMPGVLDKMDEDTYIKFAIGVASTDLEYSEQLVDKGTKRFGVAFLIKMAVATRARLEMMQELIKQAELDKAKQN